MLSRKRKGSGKRMRGASQLAKRVFRGPVGRQVAAGVVARARARRRNSVTMGFLGIEKKFYDTALTATTIPAPTDCSGAELNPTSTSLISTPAVGDSEQNREGKKINILAVKIDGWVYRDSAEAQIAPPAPCNVYVALVLDKQTNAAAMNSEDCFKNTGASALLAGRPMRNLLFATRFQILKEAEFELDIPGIGYQAANDMSWGGQGRKFSWFLRFPNGLPVNFNAGTTSSVANVIDNSLHIIAFANQASTANLLYNARIRFVG